MSHLNKISQVNIVDLNKKPKQKLRKKVERKIGKYHHSLELVRTMVPIVTLICQIYMISHLLK